MKRRGINCGSAPGHPQATGAVPTPPAALPQLYDAIGVGYARRRRPDPRIAAAIMNALGDLTPVVNVGAGAGSYEPADRMVVAVEPSPTMIAQRANPTIPVVRAFAGELPFRDGTFAASLAVLTIHHWPDRARGLAELRRVARDRTVILTHDPQAMSFWLVEDYFPEIRDIDRVTMPSLAEFCALPGRVSVLSIPIAHDCTDGFLGAYWRRPHEYLDEGVRTAISAFAKIPDVARGVRRLREDLESGAWHRRHGHWLKETSVDLGYRLLIIEWRDGEHRTSPPSRHFSAP